MPDATFACPDLTTFAGLDELGLEAVRYRCTGFGHVWRQDTRRAAEPRAKLSRRGLRWALVGVVCQHLTVARVAEGLGVSWNTANDAVLAEGQRGPDRRSRPVRRRAGDRGRRACGDTPVVATSTSP